MAEKADDLSSLITELQENKLFKMKKLNTCVLFFVTGILKHLTKDVLLKHWFTLQKLVEWQRRLMICHRQVSVVVTD